MKQFTSILAFQKHFNTEEKCRKHLELQRWNGTPECPFCENTNVYRFTNGVTFKCSDCRKKFSVTVGTVYENTKLPLTKWFMAMYILMTHKKGVSSLQLATDLGITQKSAWFMLHRLREVAREKAPELLNDIVELDETYVGGKERNKHADKRTEGNTGRSVKTKTPVFGLLERSTGKVRATVVADTTRPTIQKIVYSSVATGSIMMTDEYRSYIGLSKSYFREVVNHSAGEYVREGLFHTNGIENFWSHFKRTINGTYHQVSPKHLQRYCDESAFRYNTRKLAQDERFNYSLTNCEGRLKYKDLIAA